MIITLIILSMIMIIPSKASRQHGSWVQLDCHLKQVISMMLMMMRQWWVGWKSKQNHFDHDNTLTKLLWPWLWQKQLWPWLWSRTRSIILLMLIMTLRLPFTLSRTDDGILVRRAAAGRLLFICSFHSAAQFSIFHPQFILTNNLYLIGGLVTAVAPVVIQVIWMFA